ncbi:MAG: diguanylate cyclase [Bacillota bacterium]
MTVPWPIQITISIGVSVYPDDAHSEDGLIRTADNALYAAKQSGRDRVCRFDKSKA